MHLLHVIMVHTLFKILFFSLEQEIEKCTLSDYKERLRIGLEDE